METKHTPGPWTTKGIGPDFKGNIAAPSRGGAGEIALVINPDSEEGRANGLLMAAAPELLDAVKICIGALEIGDDMTPRQMKEILRRSYAAIAKAEGK